MRIRSPFLRCFVIRPTRSPRRASLPSRQLMLLGQDCRQMLERHWSVAGSRSVAQLPARIRPLEGLEGQSSTRLFKVVDLDQRPGMDESTFLVGLVTAICRPSLIGWPWLLAPGAGNLGVQGPGRACWYARSAPLPSAYSHAHSPEAATARNWTSGFEATPILFLDNVNGTMLRSDTLASILTERPARVRPLGRTQMVALNSTAFIALTGNGLSVSEDLARRFIVCELDARCEDPEQRKFASGLLDQIERHRAELLAAALTIWRWARQNPADLVHGRPLGSFEQWAEWCRDPLLALGCRDPIDRIDEIKSDDPHRRRIVELFEAWNVHHGQRPVKATALAEPVQVLLDPQGRGRQHIAARLVQLAGTRAGGFFSRARSLPENGAHRAICCTVDD